MPFAFPRRRIALAFLLASAAAPAIGAPMDAGFAQYLDEARGVVAALEAGADPHSQRASLERLASEAAGLVAPFSARFPVCREYLDAAMALRGQWPELSLEQIEERYHHDAALPTVSGAADQALCYQMKDLLVHPLTALRMLQDTPVDAAGLEHEIVEVVAHGQALQALVQAR